MRGRSKSRGNCHRKQQKMGMEKEEMEGLRKFRWRIGKLFGGSGELVKCFAALCLPTSSHFPCGYYFWENEEIFIYIWLNY